MKKVLLGALVALAALAGGAPRTGNAANPGVNGEITFVRPIAGGPTPGAASDLWSADPYGANPHIAIPDDFSGYIQFNAPRWSPNGKHLAFLSKGTTPGLPLFLNVIDCDAVPPWTPLTTVSGAADGARPSWSPDGRKIAYGQFDGIYVIDVDTQETALVVPNVGNIRYDQASWSPDGKTIAMRARETGVGPYNIESDIAIVPAAGGVVVNLTRPANVADYPGRDAGSPDWKPDGSKILFHRGHEQKPGVDIFGTPFQTGSALLTVDPVTRSISLISNSGEFFDPEWSPDGTQIVVTETGLVAILNADGTGFRYVTGSAASSLQGSGPADWRNAADTCTGSGFTVTLAVFTLTGEPVDDQLVVQEDFIVKLTIANGTERTLGHLRFAKGKPLVIDKRSTGGVAITSSPQIDPKLSLDPGESVEYSFTVTTTKEGIAAATSKVTAEDDHGGDVQDAHSLLFKIANAQQLTKALGQAVVLQAIDQYLFKHYREFFAGMQKRAQKLRAALTKRLDAQERLEWFGSTAEIEITNADRAIGFLRGLPPELIAASRPKAGFKGHTAEELDAAYDETFKEEVGKGVEKWVNGYSTLASNVQKGLNEAYGAAAMNVGWLNSTATAEERAQVEAFWSTLYDGSAKDTNNLINAWKAEVPRWQEDGTYAWQALEEADKEYNFVNQVKKASNFWSGVIKKETDVRASLMAIADDDPVRFQREWAKADARIMNIGLPTLFDTLLGAGVAKVVSAGGQLINLEGKGASLIAAAEETGYADNLGAEVAGPNSKLLLSEPGAPSGLTLETSAEMSKAESILKNTEGATLVQSSDYGNVYSMPNLGGVPEPTLDAKAGILKDLEKEYKTATGKSLQLAEVLKTSSPLRKPGGVAKLELTAAKTGKPSMIDAGMPDDALGEAAYWTSPTEPKDLPGFDKLSKARQDAAVEEWDAANKRYAAYENPQPNTKEAHLKELIGHRGRVPLDDVPNASGIQRFIVGEFEEIVVTKGDATAKMIRVKHYEIEVVDTTRDNLVVNRKTVIDNLAVAAPQTADADAVAVGKVVGHDPVTGAPIVEPLSRSEREFVMGRYVDKNIKARRAGLIPDAAEHGVTLVMEDAGSRVAGFLTANYGAPFLPESVGRPYLAGIAQFVAPSGTTPAQMLDIMLDAVRKQGGFGQHAVVVTSDSRYLGAVPFARW